MSTQDIYNFRKVNEQVSTGGQPTAEQLQAAAVEGFQTVINLATYKAGESLENEAKFVRSLGMNYHYIPVEWENPQLSDFDAFERVMHEVGSTKILIHCAANFRVTAFYGLYAMKNLGWTESQAEQFRMPIWMGSNYPLWEKFIQQVRENIKS